MNPVRNLLLAASNHSGIARQATRRRFVRRAVSRFMPGESLDEAIAAASGLEQRRLGTILTHLGENVADEPEAREVARHYEGVIDRIVAEGLDAEVSIKLTQLGLDRSADLALELARRILQRMARTRQRLWIDMESTAYTDRTLDFYRRLRAEYPNVGVALQAYLKRTPADLESLLPLGPAIRMVKGAYNEPADLVLGSKQEVDERFYSLSERLLDDTVRGTGAWLAAGTHDGRLIRRVEEAVARKGLARDSFEFAMLYGIRRAEQERLAAAGTHVRVLISYGPHWFPWYMRRLAERPANIWFVARNLFG